METQNFVYIVLIIQIIAILSIFLSVRFYKNIYLSTLIPKLPILTGLLTSTGIILTYLLFSTSYIKSINDSSVDATRNGFREMYKMLSDNYDKCPRFIESLNFNFVKAKFDNNNNNNNNNNNGRENQVTINYISNALFNTMGNYIITSDLSEASDARWVGLFLSQLSSKDLRERWTFFKYNYGERSRLLINYLIEVRDANKFETSDEVIKAAEKMVETQRFKDIFTHVDGSKVTLIL